MEEVPRPLLAILYIFVVVILSYITQTALPLVIVGTSPFFIYVLVMAYLKEDNVVTNWILPLVFTAVFLIVWRASLFPSITQMDGPVVAALNVIFSYFVNLIPRKGNRMETMRRTYEQQQHALLTELHHLRGHITEQQVRQFTTIEDKCKSLNFVIGRVYSSKKGGTKVLRETIRIPRDLYNSFSTLTKDMSKLSAAEESTLREVVKAMANRLVQLQEPENVVFTLGSYEKLKIKRSLLGKDRIIDVLAKNDDEPVQQYLSEALEICTNLEQYLGE